MKFMLNVQRVSMWNLSVLTTVLKHTVAIIVHNEIGLLLLGITYTPSARNMQSSISKLPLKQDEENYLKLSFTTLIAWPQGSEYLICLCTYCNPRYENTHFTVYCKILEFWVGAIVSTCYQDI